MKKCNKCDDIKPLDQFVARKRNKSGYGATCKKCHVKYMTRWKKNHPDKVRAYCKISTIKYQDAWIDFFIKRYGDKPHCEICNKVLLWINDQNNMVDTVNFDHRHNGQENIITNPKQWINIRPCNDKNKKIFESCDFGILCISCNASLPTLDCEQWVRDVVKYVFGNNVGLSRLEKAASPLPDWDY